jgi:hypothetical protein
MPLVVSLQTPLARLLAPSPGSCGATWPITRADTTGLSMPAQTDAKEKNMFWLQCLAFAPDTLYILI